MDLVEKILTLIGTIGGIIAAIPALIELRDRWRARSSDTGGTMPKGIIRAPLSLRGTIFALVSVALLSASFSGFWFYEPRSAGFHPQWPDAIVCDVTEPEGYTAAQKVPTTFLFRGIAARGKYGTVAMYYFPGWQNHSFPLLQNFPTTGYLTHEIWFNVINKALVKPTKDQSAETFFEALYRLSFPGGETYPLDCGGETIAKIKAADGRAFVFARPFK